VLADDASESTELRQRIQDIKKLKSKSNVRIFSCDVSQPKQVSEALDSAVEAFGAVDVVLHAAGVLNDGVVATRTEELIRPVFEAKSLAAEDSLPIVPRTIIWTGSANE